MKRSGVLLLPLLVLALVRCVGDDPASSSAPATDDDGGGSDGGTPSSNDAGNGDDGGTGSDASDANVDAGPPAPQGKIDWSVTFPTDAYGVRVATDASGNVYAAMTFSGTRAFGGTSLTSTGNDVAVVKMNAAGAVQWAKKIASGGADSPLAISVDGADVYVAGTFTGATIDANDGHTAAGMNGSATGFLAKLSSATGGSAWVDAFVNYGTFYGFAVRARYAKVAIAIEFAGSLIHPAGSDACSGHGVVVAFVDPTNGGFSASQFLKGTNDANVYGYGGVDIAQDGSMFVAGRTAATQITTRTAVITNSDLKGSRSGYVLKLTSGLNASWIRVFGSTNTPPAGASPGGSVLAMEADSAGNVFAAGNFAFSDFGKGDVTSSGGGSSDDVFVVKLDGSSSGTTSWAKTFGGSTSAETMSGLALDPWGQPIVTGFSTGGGTVDSMPLPTGSGIYLVKLANGNGAPQYVTGRTSGGTVSTGGVAAAPNGEAILGGTFTGALDLKTSVDAVTSADAFVAGFTP